MNVVFVEDLADVKLFAKMSPDLVENLDEMDFTKSASWSPAGILDITRNGSATSKPASVLSHRFREEPFNVI